MKTDRYDELIVFIIRETGLSLEYIRKIPYSQLTSLVDELSYQKAIDNYNRNYPLGVIAAILASDVNRKRRPEDFIGRPPKRKGKDDLWKQAKTKGIKTPKD